jgi:hypothetical protein
MTANYNRTSVSASTKTTQITGNNLGTGGNGKYYALTNLGTVPSSGGGGYYGDTAPPQPTYYYQCVSDSGSSYISGHPGCVSLDTNTNIHSSGIRFINTIMKNGLESFPSINSSLETGHQGDGAIRITRLSICSNKKSRYFTLVISFLSISISLWY